MISLTIWKSIHMLIHEYYKQGFTYIELGDGIELWENDSS